jgi:hypothetical protein
MLPVADGEAATHELFGSNSARAYVANEQRLQQFRDGSVRVA